MESTILLHYQGDTLVDYDEERIIGNESQTITGVELRDGTYYRGASYQQGTPEKEVVFGWPLEKAERLVDYYSRYLVKQELGTESQGWNCFSFVAAIMSWEVYWDNAPYPHSMPIKKRRADTSWLEDHQPYAISNFLQISHSMIGTPYPDRNLAVWGRGKLLRLTSTAMTLASYPGAIHAHKEPNAVYNRFMSRLCNFSPEVPSVFPNQQRPKPTSF